MKNTLAIMQPYFFPYLGYFPLIALAERGVIFDTAQYCRRRWMNCNRMFDNKGGWQYINIPVNTTLGNSIRCADVELAGRRDHLHPGTHVNGMLMRGALRRGAARARGMAGQPQTGAADSWPILTR